MRVVTRGDMDGLVGAVIVSLHEPVEDIELIHPQDITSGQAEIRSGDVLINVPYHPACSLWFDHHQHTATYEKPPERFEGAYGNAPSAAHLVYEYFGGRAKMPQLAALVHETDRMDSADLTPQDVIDPKGFIQLGFTIDARTGIGAFRGYFQTLFDLLRAGTSIEEILAHPEVARRRERMERGKTEYRIALREHSRIQANVVVTDFRPLKQAPVANRFLVYAVFPTVNVSMRVHWGPAKEFVVAVLGHSIFNRGCNTDLGELAKRYGGGGHRGAASIPLLLPLEADDKVKEIVAELVRNG